MTQVENVPLSTSPSLLFFSPVFEKKQGMKMMGFRLSSFLQARHYFGMNKQA
jgi:hypothetical protein